MGFIDCNPKTDNDMKISIEEVNKLKRFDIEHVNREESDGNLYTGFDMVERSDGGYVKFSDIQSLFESKGLFIRKKPYKATVIEIDDNPVHIAQDIVDGLVEDRKHHKLYTGLSNSMILTDETDKIIFSWSL